MTVSRSQRPTLFRRSIALRQVIASSQVRNAASPRKLAELPVGRDERLLRHVVRIGRRPERGQGGAEDRPPVPLDQLAERVGVPGLGPAHQVECPGRRPLTGSAARLRSHSQ